MLAVALTACETELPLDVEEMDDILCMNGFLTAESDSNFVYITTTGKQKYKNVQNAEVQLTINGETVETVNKPDEYSGRYRLTTKFNAGDNVRIDVNCNGKHIWAEEVAPEKIDDLSAKINTSKIEYEHVENFWYDTESYRADYTINFSDKENQTDYYRLLIGSKVNVHETYNFVEYVYDEETWDLADSVVTFHDSTFYHNNVPDINYGYENEPILTDGESKDNSSNNNSMTSDDLDLFIMMLETKNKYRIFDDRRFENSTATIHVYNTISPLNYRHAYGFSDYIYTVDYQAIVRVLKISASYYYYLQAINIMQAEGYDDMSELSGPIKLPSNVNNGGGNIAIATPTDCVVKVFENYKQEL